MSQTLTRMQLTVMYLLCEEALNQDEAAALLGISKETVRTHASDARIALGSSSNLKAYKGLRERSLIATAKEARDSVAAGGHGWKRRAA